MLSRCAAGFVVTLLFPLSLAAQSAPVTGDHSTPLRALAGDGTLGITNAVLTNNDEVRVLRVVVEPGGTRALHTHTDVRFHLFVPISGAMQLELDGGKSVEVQPWQPCFMEAGTQHGFHNSGSAPVEIMEIFVK
jgi:mannose-6-phosphate isomerase-like protein (cupin superfamily)